MVAIVFISKGYAITVYSIPRAQARSAFLWGGCLTLFYFIEHVYGSFLFVFIVIVYVFIIRDVLQSTRFLELKLKEQADLLTANRVNVDSTAITPKRIMFKRFQNALAIFVMVEVLYYVWSQLMPNQSAWEDTLKEEVSYGSACLLIGFAFRMRPFSPVIHHIRRIGDPAEGADLEANRRPVGPPPLWRPGAPMPKFPSDYLGSFSVEKRGVIVVHNPSVTGSDGRERVDVVLGRSSSVALLPYPGSAELEDEPSEGDSPMRPLLVQSY